MPAKRARDRRGFLIPPGGAEDKMSDATKILKRFVRLCGRRASIAIIPTASRLEDTGTRYEGIFGELGVASVRSLDFKRREDSTNAEWLAFLRDEATGIFLTGGNQLRISTILGGTDVARAIRSANARGVTVGGTSAGAAILSEHMIAFGKSGSTPRAGMVSLAPGFGLTNRVVIDQHFRQRDRIGRLLSALAFNPFAVGVGLDEDTAAFIDARASGTSRSRLAAPGISAATALACWTSETAGSATALPARHRRIQQFRRARRAARPRG